jgi:alpha-tubulin suppressor-like RCC1 family protein
MRGSRLVLAGLAAALVASTGCDEIRRLLGPPHFAAVSAGGSHSCGVAGDGAASCWGTNPWGQLGNGSRAPDSVPDAVATDLRFTQLSAGWTHTCALTAAGLANCWGANDYGEVGDGTTGYRTAPQPVGGLLTFIQISAGDSHTCAVAVGGAAYCWGLNGRGELGATSSETCVNPVGGGSVPCSTSPLPVSGGHSFISVSAGVAHSCGVASGGAGYCWGNGSSGELGTNSRAARTAPGLVADAHVFASVTAGSSHSCGVTTGNVAYCWGANSAGQLGDGTTSPDSVPVAVTGSHAFRAVTASIGSYTCGVTTAGDAYCWGAGAAGNMGNGTFNVVNAAPGLVSGGFMFLTVSPGADHACGVVADSTAYCWGNGALGQLGQAATWISGTPVQVVSHR